MEILFVSFEESLFIIIIAVLLFGPKKIPEIARYFSQVIYQLQTLIEKIKEKILLTDEKIKESLKNNSREDKK